MEVRAFRYHGVVVRNGGETRFERTPPPPTSPSTPQLPHEKERESLCALVQCWGAWKQTSLLEFFTGRAVRYKVERLSVVLWHSSSWLNCESCTSSCVDGVVSP